MLRDIFNKLATVVSVLPQVVTASIASPTSVELDDAEGVNFDAIVGTNGGTLDGSNYLELILEDSPDNSTWTAVTDPNRALGLTPNASTGVIVTVDDAAEDDAAYTFGYIGPERFVRLRPAVTGAGVSIPLCITATKGYKHRNAL